MFDAFKMLGKLGEIKEKAKVVKEELRFVEITHSSEDGLITIYLDGLKNIRKIDLNENMLNPASKAELEEKLVIELNAAYEKADKEGKARTKEALKDSLPNIPGLDLDNLPF